MTQKDFASTILQSTQPYWGMVLAGKRNLGYKKAQAAASVLNTSVDLWMNPKANPNERKAAWNQFSSKRAK